MTDNLETIENAITPYGGYASRLSDDFTRFIFQMPNGEHAVLVYCEEGREGTEDGDPEAYAWSIALMDGDHEEVDGHDDITLDAALFYVRLWREAATKH